MVSKLLTLAILASTLSLSLATRVTVWPFFFRNRSCRYCFFGKICAGPEHAQRCVYPMQEGGKCGQDPYWVCAGGLECEHGTCIAPPISKGESCLKSGSRCEDGLVCTGTDHDKRCVQPMEEGGQCGQDPFWICVDGLDCVDGICAQPKIAKGESCLKSGSRCEDGLVCTGTNDDKRCVQPMEEGGQCGQDPFWICVDGLDCVYGICTKPKIAKGESCLESGSRCEDTLVCAGTDDDKRCVEPMKKNESCGQDPFWVCEASLKCVYHVCV